MVSIREIQSGIVEEEENKVNSEDASVAQTDNFLDAVNIKDSSAADLDKRFFSGAVPNSAKMRNEIDNAIGYKSFKTFYDDYVEFNTKYNKGAKLKTKSELQDFASRGKYTNQNGIVISDVSDSPLIPFAEGTSYDDKIKIMSSNRDR